MGRLAGARLGWWDASLALEFDTSEIATPEAVTQARDLDLAGAEVAGPSTCIEGDVTTLCTYPIRRRDGISVTVEVVRGPPDADYVGGDDIYAASEPATILSITTA